MTIRRPITYVSGYYNNAGMLREQFDVWRRYPAILRAQFHAVICDDCSVDAALPYVEPTGIASFQLFRTAVDIRWNWLFCRNLGVAKATTDWVLLTDIDHVVPVETLAVLVGARLDDQTVYRFSRVDAPDRTPYKPHPNSWLMTRAMFDAIGGYDERFSGYYGSDADFRERVKATARNVHLLSSPLLRYPRDVIPDASTPPSSVTMGEHWQACGPGTRKTPADHYMIPKIRAERNRDPGWRPWRLTFDYEHQVTLCA